MSVELDVVHCTNLLENHGHDNERLNGYESRLRALLILFSILKEYMVISLDDTGHTDPQWAVWAH